MPDALGFLILTVLLVVATTGIAHLSFAWNRYNIRDRIPRKSHWVVRLTLGFALFSCLVCAGILLLLVNQRMIETSSLVAGLALGAPLGVAFVRLLLWSDARTTERFRRSGSVRS